MIDVSEKHESSPIVDKKSCSCTTCKNACKSKPGWFHPNQVELLLKYYKVKTVRQLVDQKKVILDWWDETNGNILVLAPNILGNDSIQYPGDPQGQCLFFKDDKCSIHEIKPFECSEYIHTDNGTGRSDDRHKLLRDEWGRTDILEEFRSEIYFAEYSPDSIFNY